MNTFSEPLEELNRRFWEEVHPRIRARAELDQIETGEFIFGGASRLEGFQYPPRILAMSRFLADRVDELVKAELFSVSHMHFSCPTRFGLLYFGAVTRHYPTVKRKYLSRESPDYRHDFSAAGYDVEQDITLCEKKVAEFWDSHFQTERLYLEAFDKKHFEDANALLGAIEIARRDADITLRNEASNWRIDLACVTGNIAMFIAAWQRIPRESIVKRELLCSHIERLLYAGIMNGIGVGLTAEGERAAKRSGNRQEFATNQIRHLMRSTIEEIADWLIATDSVSVTFEKFRSTVNQKFEGSRRAALAANPLLTTLMVDYKPSWLK